MFQDGINVDALVQRIDLLMMFDRSVDVTIEILCADTVLYVDAGFYGFDKLESNNLVGNFLIDRRTLTNKQKSLLVENVFGGYDFLFSPNSVKRSVYALSFNGSKSLMTEIVQEKMGFLKIADV